MNAMRGLTVLVTCTLLVACMAHGPDRRRDPRVYVNYTPYSEAFYRELMTGRVWLFGRTAGRNANVVNGLIFLADGSVMGCFPSSRIGNDQRWNSVKNRRWSLQKLRSGVRTEWIQHGRKSYASHFYDPKTGAFDTELLRRGKWARTNPGVIQDTWPRVLADSCPSLRLPAHIMINEKQTASRIHDLRRQDPDAPVRHFPGSEMTAPGRTGLGRSQGQPTTTREEVRAFVKSQIGNILLSPSETGYVLVGGEAASKDEIWTGEVWRLDDKGRLMAHAAWRAETDASGQDWVVSKIPGQPELRYPVGYPFPILPTGYRHAAFQLTDRLIDSGEPVALPWMPEKWKDFTFRADGTVLARRADGEPDDIAPWLWTRGRLWVQIDGNREAPGWEEVAEQLGLEKPRLWTKADGQRIGPRASAATSGTAKSRASRPGR